MAISVRNYYLCLLLFFGIASHGMDPPPIQPKPDSQSCNEIRAIESIAEFISKAVELSHTGRVLVVFDLDNVLIRTQTRKTVSQEQYEPEFLQLGPEMWREMQNVRASCAFSMTGSYNAQACGLTHQKPTTSGHNYIPGRLAGWVNHLTKITDVIGLTMRSSRSQARLRQSGINLTGQSNAIDIVTTQTHFINSQNSGYRENIIYTNHNPKGNYLLEFYNLSNEYDTVLFIDDLPGNVQNVVNTLSAAGINVLGFWLKSETLGKYQPPQAEAYKSRAFFFHPKPDGDDDNDDTENGESDDSWPDIN
ncbi:DUF2608 domain-containing protein [Endozoicomonas euniceicola]|uniref:DUF2608 domain-containing protein n=1 Tax=Endozoicomonas euniceicola TaxID=1234143 RepID=A0ABY6H0S7_9GAMM|nr:DUF2608 domain-containing protein [Endozoicomonas euniceicola]UYM17881.1 DUF2608 domain-containing protein [Endozoicomonas euniceicola]